MVTPRREQLTLTPGRDGGVEALHAAQVGEDSTAICALRPLMPEYPRAAPCLVNRWTSRMGSSRSTNAIACLPASNRGLTAQRPTRLRECMASSRRTCPKVNARRNVPYVQGARTPPKTSVVPLCRTTSRSSILSAPAGGTSRLRGRIPAMTPAASPRRSGWPRSSAPGAGSATRRAAPGASPARDRPNRSGSGHREPRRPGAMLALVGCPFATGRIELSQVQSSRPTGAFARHDPLLHPNRRRIRAEVRLAGRGHGEHQLGGRVSRAPRRPGR